MFQIKEPEKPKKQSSEKKKTVPDPKSDIRNYIPSTTNKENIKNSDKIKSKSHGLSNIVGFDNIIVKNNHLTNSKTPIKTLSNSSNTITINVKNNKTCEATKTNINSFNGPGNILSSNISLPITNYSPVRNHWVNKFCDTNTVNKKRSLHNEDGNNSKKAKLDSTDCDVTCPVCNKKFKETLINTHLDECIGKQNEGDNDCFVVNDEEIPCDICSQKVLRSSLQKHLKTCVENVFSSNDFTDAEIDVPKNITETKLIKCPVCSADLSTDTFSQHVDNCFHKMFDEIENKLKSTVSEVICPVCNMKVLESGLNSHIDYCLENKDIYTGSNKKFHCPSCLELILETEMSSHINDCLNNSNAGLTGNKSILLDSFSNDDF